MTDARMPERARVVIIGGGVIGASVAYHLTREGWTDVVLLEQGRLSGGTTWHAAGLVGQLRSHSNMTSLIRYSTKLYAELAAETGLETGWKNCGSISVARTEDRMIVLRRTAASARAQGVECEIIGADEAGRLWPMMETRDLKGAAWLPGDGKANPTDLTQSLAKGARDRGARIVEKVRVTGIRTADGSRHRRRDRSGRDRGRDRRELRRPMGAQGRPDGGRRRADAFRRAHVRRDRPDRRRDARPAGDARPRRPHLLQGGGRRPRHGRLRAGGETLGHGRHPRRFRVPASARRLGPVRDPDGERADPGAGARNGRDQAILQRPRELHPRRQLHPRRGAGAAQLLRRRRLQLGGHRERRRRGPGAGRMDRERRADDGSLAGRHPPLRALQQQSALPARARQGDARPALRHAMAEPRIRDRAPVPPFAALRPAGRTGRRLRLEDGLGAAELVRRAGRAARDPLRLRTPELVRRGRARASRDPERRRGLRRDVLRQAADPRPGRGRDARPALRRGCRRGAGAHGLYRHAERTRRLRERPDRDAAVRGSLSPRDRIGPARPRRGLDQAKHARRRPRGAHGCHLVLVRPVGHGTGLARPACPAHVGGPHQCRIPVRHAPMDRPRRRDGHGQPHELCGRARLGALRADGNGGGRL